MDEPLKFFLVTPLGFEELAFEELNEKYFQLHQAPIKARIVHGGVEFEASLKNGCELNHYLKIPSKILLRISEFRCRDFPRLFNKLKKIDIKRYFQNFIIKAESRKSRLQNEKRILKVAQDAWQPRESVPNEVLIRFFEDQCTVSINTSGELLYKRGYKLMVSRAPIRENIAAALIKLLVDEFDYILLDPMCGGATFLLEALSFYEPIDCRSFAFENFLKNSSLYSLKGPRPKMIFGYDIESTLNAVHNLETLKNKLRLKFEYKIGQKDLFTESKPLNENTFIICNPPYGKAFKLNQPPVIYYQELLNRLTLYKPHRIGCIFPIKYSHPKSPGYKIIKKLNFSNGGIAVSFNIYEKIDD